MRRCHDLNVCTRADELIKLLSGREYRAVTRTRYSKTEYIDITATADIETTNTPDDGFIYSIALNVDGVNYVCRYIEDFIQVVDKLLDEFGCYDQRRLVLYIHNLGYEYWYMLQILHRAFTVSDILLTKSHKPLYVRFENGLELRDSLKLFQKSLATLTKGLPHEKRAGDLDYTRYRTPDTPLTPDEWGYVVFDVQGLYEAIEKLKTDYGYHQGNIPLTNTSRVIGEVNKAIKGDRATFTAMQSLRLSKTQLKLAYKCMAGGDTHGARWRAGVTYEGANSVDFKSAHPSQMLLRPFPSGTPYDMKDVDAEMLDALIEAKQGFVARILIVSPRCKPENPDPTISISKCAALEGLQDSDNGRLIAADGCIVYMDSNDYQRFKDGYTWEHLEALELTGFGLKPLPRAFRDAIMAKFKDKETAPDELARNFGKICVNTIFGACAQKTIRDEYCADYETLDAECIDWEENLAQKTDEEVAKSQKTKFPFLWGLWTSSLTRLELWKLLKVIGWERVIYWDTDSCKYKGEKVREIEDYNAEIVRLNEEAGTAFEKNGKPVYIGYAEDEHPGIPYGYRRFRFLHAKCYAVEAWHADKGAYQIETTIAGVGKKEGAAAMRGTIDTLDDGLYIPVAGGNKLRYESRPITVRKEWKRETVTASFIYMIDRDYMLNWDRFDIIEQREDEIML